MYIDKIKEEAREKQGESEGGGNERDFSIPKENSIPQNEPLNQSKEQGSSEFSEIESSSELSNRSDNVSRSRQSERQRFNNSKFLDFSDILGDEDSIQVDSQIQENEMPETSEIQAQLKPSPPSYRNFIEMKNDACLNDIFFINQRQGWAVGDRGTIWITFDGGGEWLLSDSPVDCNLFSVHFWNEQLGIIVGGTVLPGSANGKGVILRTVDGGRSWAEIPVSSFPILRKVKFIAPDNVWISGDSSELYPGGIFLSQDNGLNWTPVSSNRHEGWKSLVFDPSNNNGIGVGLEGTVQLAKKAIRPVSLPNVGKRRFIELSQGNFSDPIWMVGENGLVMYSQDNGENWQRPAGILPNEASEYFDFSAIYSNGPHLWLAGTPGSFVFFSSDSGAHWNAGFTGIQVPIRKICFIDPMNGWAVGELGNIIATQDGGQSWTVQREGGRRLALLGLFAKSDDIPFEAFVQWAGDEGYLIQSLLLAREEKREKTTDEIPDSLRIREALLETGTDGLLQNGAFVLDSDDWDYSIKKILERFDRENDGKGLDKFRETLVRQIRIWRPDVLLIRNDVQKIDRVKQTQDELNREQNRNANGIQPQSNIQSNGQDENFQIVTKQDVEQNNIDEHIINGNNIAKNEIIGDNAAENESAENKTVDSEIVGNELSDDKIVGNETGINGNNIANNPIERSNLEKSEGAGNESFVHDDRTSNNPENNPDNETDLNNEANQWQQKSVESNQTMQNDLSFADFIENELPLAIRAAADPLSYPEHMTQCRLEPWAVSKVFRIENVQTKSETTLRNDQKLFGTNVQIADSPKNQTTQNHSESNKLFGGAKTEKKYDLCLNSSFFCPSLGRSIEEIAQNARNYLRPELTTVSTQIHFKTLLDRTNQDASSLPGINSLVTVSSGSIFSGLNLPSGGEARRPVQRGLLDQREELLERASVRRQNLGIMNKMTQSSLKNGRSSEIMLSQIHQMIRGMDADMAIEYLNQLGKNFYQQGKLTAAEEVYSTIALEFPTNPKSREALIWLVQFYAGKEPAWRTQETNRAQNSEGRLQQDGLEGNASSRLAIDSSKTNSRYRNADQLGKLIRELYPELYMNPEIRFPLAMIQRERGFNNNALQYYLTRGMISKNDLWGIRARAEYWLLTPNRDLLPPEDRLCPLSMINCQVAPAKPFLDGILEPEIWNSARGISLSQDRMKPDPKIMTPEQKNKAKQETLWQEENKKLSTDFGSCISMLYDNEFLYLGIQCRKVLDYSYKTNHSPRFREADLTPFDRFEIQLDLDRDYSSAYRFVFDYRGWANDASWNDPNWNPQIFIAQHETDDLWSLEVAIPWEEICERPPTRYEVWAISMRRIIPNVGMECWNVDNSCNGENGFGFLTFGLL